MTSASEPNTTTAVRRLLVPIPVGSLNSDYRFENRWREAFFRKGSVQQYGHPGPLIRNFVCPAALDSGPRLNQPANGGSMIREARIESPNFAVGIGGGNGFDGWLLEKADRCPT